MTVGDFVICNANVPHGEDPFREHHIQTYCLVLSGAKLEFEADERPIISLGKENAIVALSSIPQAKRLLGSLSAFCVGYFLPPAKKIARKKYRPDNFEDVQSAWE